MTHNEHDSPRERVSTLDGIVLTPEQKRGRRNRNIAIGIAIGFFVILFYVVTIAKLSVMSKPL